MVVRLLSNDAHTLNIYVSRVALSPEAIDAACDGRSQDDMSFDQIAALVVLIAVVAVLIHGKLRSDVAALSGAAAL